MVVLLLLLLLLLLHKCMLLKAYQNNNCNYYKFTSRTFNSNCCNLFKLLLCGKEREWVSEYVRGCIRNKTIRYRICCVFFFWSWWIFCSSSYPKSCWMEVHKSASSSIVVVDDFVDTLEQFICWNKIQYINININT